MKPFQFIKEVTSQAKQISWPDKKTVLKLSTTVIIVSLISSLILGSFDLLFATTFAKISKTSQNPNQLENMVEPELNIEDLATDSADLIEATPSTEPQN